jgi:prepilin-type N-terminal cleavage/methylation domain-containing protein
MNRKLEAYSRVWGFTLLELMVVVAIIAIVSAAVVPSFSMSLRRNRQREAANLIVQAVFAARSRAARTGRCHRVVVTTSDTKKDGGTGGSVSVDEYRDQWSECGHATNAANWSRLSSKTVGNLVGKDVAILRVVDNTCSTELVSKGSTVTMRFEPTGGVFVNDAAERFFEIATEGVSVNRHVRISTGGSVRYTLCE